MNVFMSVRARWMAIGASAFLMSLAGSSLAQAPMPSAQPPQAAPPAVAPAASSSPTMGPAAPDAPPAVAPVAPPPSAALPPTPPPAVAPMPPASAPAPAPDETAAPQPFAFADFGWMNGQSRQTEFPLDGKVIIGDVHPRRRLQLRILAIPSTTRIVGSTSAGRANEFQITHLGVGADFHWKGVARPAHDPARPVLDHDAAQRRQPRPRPVGPRATPTGTSPRATAATTSTS